jgi:hypothetical protein
MKHKIISSVENGNLKRNREQVKQAIAEFEGKNIVITIEKLKKSRSNNQNAYYWGVVIPIVQSGLKDATGEFRSADSIHYGILLPLFSPTNEIVNIDTGQVLSEKISSSEMTTVQFMEYVLEVQKWSAEFLGVDIPNPNEEILLNLD